MCAPSLWLSPLVSPFGISQPPPVNILECVFESIVADISSIHRLQMRIRPKSLLHSTIWHDLQLLDIKLIEKMIYDVKYCYYKSIVLLTIVLSIFECLFISVYILSSLEIFNNNYIWRIFHKKDFGRELSIISSYELYT